MFRMTVRWGESAVYSNKTLLTPTSSGGGRAGLTVVTTSDMSRLCSALMSRTMKKRWQTGQPPSASPFLPAFTNSSTSLMMGDSSCCWPFTASDIFVDVLSDTRCQSPCTRSNERPTAVDFARTHRLILPGVVDHVAAVHCPRPPRG